MKKFFIFSLPSVASLLLLFIYPLWSTPDNCLEGLSFINIDVDSTDVFCSLSNEDCSADVSIHFKVTQDCVETMPDVSVQVDLMNDGIYDGSAVVTGIYPNYEISGHYETGVHSFEISVSNSCDLEAVSSVVFEIADCVVNPPECISGLIVELDAPLSGVESEAQLWSADFLSNGGVDCSGSLHYSIYKKNDILAGAVLPTPGETSVVVGCDDEMILPLRIYVWDEADNPYAVQPDGTIGGANYAYCETVVEIRHNDCSCLGAIDPVVAGSIKTEENRVLEGVAVSIERAGAFFTVLTNAAGNFSSAVVPLFSIGSVVPSYDVDPKNGVTVSDMIILARYILGTTPLDSPYKLIAADVNGSGTITALDIVHIRRLLLGEVDKFPNNTSWRFVPVDYFFPSGEGAPLNYPEMIEFGDCASYFTRANFVAIKIGDLNASAVLN